MQARPPPPCPRPGLRVLLCLGLTVLWAGCSQPAHAATPRGSPDKANEAARAEFRVLARKLRAPGATIEDPCRAQAEGACSQTALTPFFKALGELTRAEAKTPVVVAAVGNSLIAADKVVDRVRARLVERFGDGGRGLLLAERIGSYGPRTRTGTSPGGWEPRHLGELDMPPLVFGVTGVYHRATKANARTRFRLHGERRGTLWWLDAPRAGALSIYADGKRVARTRPRGTGQAKSVSWEQPAQARTLEIVAEREGAVVMGVVLQHERPGVVLDTLGVPSADASLLLRADERIIRDQWQERSPRLVMLLLGGNETKRLEWRRTNRRRVEKDLRALIRRTKTANPDAACLVVGPIDAVRGDDTSTPGVERPHLRKVIALQRQIAIKEGCAFFDFFAAMGGPGSFRRFERAGLVHDDRVHPRGKGLDLLGELLAEGLMQAWDESPEGRSSADDIHAEVSP